MHLRLDATTLQDASSGIAATADHPGRQLLALPSYCQVQPWEQNGGWVLYVVGVVYLVLGLVLINNHYFMPSLRSLGRRLGLSDDVAGATVFAGGSSAPFLFFGFFSLLAPSSAIPNAAGIVSTVGAGTANVLAVIGISAAFCMPRALPVQQREIETWPLIRDCGCWVLTIVILGAMCHDGKIHWWEGFIMVVLYCLYVLLNAVSPRILAAVDARAARALARASPRAALPSRHGAAAAHMADSAMEIADAGGSQHKDATSTSRDVTGMPSRLPPSDTRRGTATVPAADGATPALPALRSLDSAQSIAERAAPSSGDGNMSDPHGSAALPGHLGEHVPITAPAAAAGPSAGAAVEASGGFRASAEANSGAPGGSRTEAAVAAAQRVEPGRLPVVSAAAAAAEAVQRRRSGSHGACHQPERPAYAQLQPPVGWLSRARWGVCIPWHVAMACTVPDCRSPRFKRMYLLTALLSFAWVGFDSWFLLLWTLKVGCVARAPLTVMGATALAVGSTMLTALVSFVVAHQGKATMAMSNALGSNVFNVLIGLGVPYWIVQAVRGHPADIDVSDLWVDVGILLAAVAYFLAALAAFRGRLTRGLGWTLLAGYGGYMLYVVLTDWVFDAYNRN